MRQQENKKENFRENPPKLTWIPKVYNYAERTGNLHNYKPSEYKIGRAHV